MSKVPSSSEDKDKMLSGVVMPNWEKHNVSSFQALQKGIATEHQQKEIVSFLIHEICRTYDMPYREKSQRDTDFLLGRMFVGQQIIKMFKINIMNFNKEEQKNDRPNTSSRTRRTKY